MDGPETPAMETAWIPNPDEIERINAGAPVVLRVLGTAHPPVMIEVGTFADATPRISPHDPTHRARLRWWRGCGMGWTAT